MRTQHNLSNRLFYACSYFYLFIVAMLCLIPFILLIINSLASERSVILNGLTFFPEAWSLLAYESIFSNPKQIGQAYLVTIGVTVTGTVTGVFLMAMAGYVLQRKEVQYRNALSFLIYFTTIFSGGLIPFYILMTTYLNLKDTYLSLILPGLMTPFLIILMRSFMKSIPESVIESARIDGAGDFSIFLKLVLPLTLPALATVGLFLGLHYWNDWVPASFFITSGEKLPLQLLLYRILKSAEFYNSELSRNAMLAAENPSETLKLAFAVIATGPIIFLYPFVQRYFVKGLTVGAVKG